MVKPRKKTYTMDMYLDKMMDQDIRSDADVQRLSGQWDKSMINELVVTVLTDDYMHPIILGEEANSQLWVIDGLQRSASLMSFRHGNYKITSAVEDAMIPYMAKARDDNGNVIVDGDGNIVWEETSFDIKNKTYDELPEELKKRFNEYQVETVIHEDCDKKRISKLIKRYNNHTAMNTNQKAFTYIDNFARDIRGVLDNTFFVNCGSYTEKDRTKGVLERVVLESVMCMFHMDNWKKQTKQICTYLNTNASREEFATLNRNLCRLEQVLTDDIKHIFNCKDSFIWLTLYHRFTHLGLDDVRFAEFLRAFTNGLKDKRINGVLFNEADKNKGTKDKAVIFQKLKILEALMYDFLGLADVEQEQLNVLEFVRALVDPGISDDDIWCYQEDLEALSLNVDNHSRLLENRNRPSLLAVVAYGYKEDKIIDDWFVNYFQSHDIYSKNQKNNYLHMKDDLNDYIAG